MDAEAERPPAPFIVGVGRSGTTLLRMMLDAHPQLAIPPETNFLPKVRRLCDQAEDPWTCFVDNLAGRKRWPDFHVDAEGLRDRVASVQPFDVAEALRCFYRLYAERFRKPRWGDKTPRYAEHMELIQALLPEGRFIHVIRDGRDVALSHRDLWFGPDSVEEAAGWWAAKVRTAQVAGQSQRFYLEIRYEDLVLETERTLREACWFLDLPWDRAMLDYHTRAAERVAELTADVPAKNRPGQVTAEQRRGIFAMTAKPPQASRVGRWRREMSASDARAFESVAGELLESLRYERT